MATASINSPVYNGAQSKTDDLTIKDAVEALSREERFMGTVHAMNTLLIHKGLYTQKEFDAIFCRWARTQLKRDRNDRPGHSRSILARLFR
jgi:3-hydroxyacyl-CoA dehydrogenase